MRNPYEHLLSSTGNECADNCPACRWAKLFVTTGNAQKSSIPVSEDLGTKELNVRFEKQFGS